MSSVCANDVDKIEKLLEEVAKEEGIHNYKIEVVGGSSKGDGYVGIIKSVRINGKDDANNDKVLNLIVKRASKNDAFRSAAPVAEIYQREICMYNAVFPTFRELEIKNGQPPSHFAPNYYRGHTRNKYETLILENLAESGYQLFERRNPMDEQHVKLVLDEFGRFHALSYALKDQNAEKFAELTGSFTDEYVNFLKRTRYLDCKCSKAQEALNSVTDREAIAAYKKYLSELTEFFDELLASVDQYSVILHGDCWTNNMMFKYEDMDNPNKPTKVCFFDYQLARLGSPVLDVAYFFLVCSSKEIIDNAKCYLEFYYDSLSSHLRRLGSNPEKMYPRSIFEEHWRKFSKYGLLLASLILHLMFTEENEAIDVSDVLDSGTNISHAFDYRISNVDAYNDRIRHIILYLVQNKLI